MGPLTRTVRDAALTLNAIAGYDPRDASSSRAAVKDYVPGREVSIRGARVGLPENAFFARAAAEVREAAGRMARIAESLGAAVTPVRVPDMEAVNAVGRVILLAEAAAVMEANVIAGRSRFGPDVLALLDQGRLIPAADYVNAQRLRRAYIEHFREVWRQVDCLFTPATPTGAPRIGQTTLMVGGEVEDVRLATTRFVRGINVIGAPALTLPCGFGADGMPLGLQIVGRPFEEDVILRVAAALEDATGFHKRRPEPV